MSVINYALRFMAMVGFTHHPALQKLSKRAVCLCAYGFTSRTGYAPYDWSKGANALQTYVRNRGQQEMFIGVEEEVYFKIFAQRCQ